MKRKNMIVYKCPGCGYPGTTDPQFTSSAGDTGAVKTLGQENMQYNDIKTSGEEIYCEVRMDHARTDISIRRLLYTRMEYFNSDGICTIIVSLYYQFRSIMNIDDTYR